MSISEKIAQLTSIRTAIRTALTAKGVADAGTHNYGDFAEDIGSIQTGGELPDKGFVFEDYDSDGYPTTARIKGFTAIPGRYLNNFGTFSGTFVNNITTIVLDEGIEEIGDYALTGYKYATISLPSTILKIKDAAFLNSKIETVTIPASAVEISTNVFKGNTSLTEVRYEGTVPDIKNSQFMNCSKIVLYDFSNHTGAIPTLYSVASLGHASGCVIKVPQALLTQWQSATNWTDLTDVVWQGV